MKSRDLRFNKISIKDTQSHADINEKAALEIIPRWKKKKKEINLDQDGGQ